jgi:hypothetical protein
MRQELREKRERVARMNSKRDLLLLSQAEQDKKKRRSSEEEEDDRKERRVVKMVVLNSILNFLCCGCLTCFSCWKM